MFAILWYLKIFLVGFVAVYLVVIINKYLRILYLSRKFPGPPALPLIGNGLMFLNTKSSENMKILYNLHKSFGNRVRVWMGPQLYFFMNDPTDIEVLFSSTKFIQKSNDYDFLRHWLGDGLLLSNGQKWHQRRKILTPAFHFQILEQFVEVFDQESNIFVKVLKKYQPNDNVELFPLVTLYALDVICDTAMGITINTQLDSKSDYALAIKEIAHIIHRRQFNFSERYNFVYQFTSTSLREKKILKILHDFTDNVIRQRREKILIELEKSVNCDSDLGIKQRKTFLDLLLETTVDGKPLSDLDIREEVDTFMFEGHDTTTSGIAFTFYCIAKYPEVQEKCIREIYQVMGTDKEKPTTYAQLNQLSYLEKVIKESLRLFPSVPLLGRHLKEEVTINERTYPADSSIITSVYLIGRNEKYFPNPEEFRPERFDVNVTGERTNAFAYIPFSAGPRNCIGQKFAMLSLKNVISKVLKNFHIQLDEGSVKEPIVSAELILTTENPIEFKLSPRLMDY